MSKAEYLSYLERRLQELESRMKADKQRIAEGRPREKIEASGDLALIERRLEETTRKLSRLKSEPEGAWESIKIAFEQELDHIKAAFEAWAERHE